MEEDVSDSDDETYDSDAEYERRKEMYMRTLSVEYYSRSDDCKERKWDHYDRLDAQFEKDHISREDHIRQTTLLGKQTVLEPNMFPYETPENISHYTLWSREDLTHEQVEEFVYRWIQDHPKLSITAWNYDDNAERSIDIYHIHVYLQSSKV